MRNSDCSRSSADSRLSISTSRVELCVALLLFGASLLLLAEDAAALAGVLLLELAAVAFELADLFGKFDFALG